jgi:hypothetical protein
MVTRQRGIISVFALVTAWSAGYLAAQTDAKQLDRGTAARLIRSVPPTAHSMCHSTTVTLQSL